MQGATTDEGESMRYNCTLGIIDSLVNSREDTGKFVEGQITNSAFQCHPETLTIAGLMNFSSSSLNGVASKTNDILPENDKGRYDIMLPTDSKLELNNFCAICSKNNYLLRSELLKSVKVMHKLQNVSPNVVSENKLNLNSSTNLQESRTFDSFGRDEHINCGSGKSKHKLGSISKDTLSSSPDSCRPSLCSLVTSCHLFPVFLDDPLNPDDIHLGRSTLKEFSPKSDRVTLINTIHETSDTSLNHNDNLVHTEIKKNGASQRCGLDNYEKNSTCESTASYFEEIQVSQTQVEKDDQLLSRSHTDIMKTSSVGNYRNFCSSGDDDDVLRCATILTRSNTSAFAVVEKPLCSSSQYTSSSSRANVCLDMTSLLVTVTSVIKSIRSVYGGERIQVGDYIIEVSR